MECWRSLHKQVISARGGFKEKNQQKQPTKQQKGIAVNEKTK